MESPEVKKALLVGLVGRAGSGKDTACCLMREVLRGKEVVRVAFGDEVKKELADNTGVPFDTIVAKKKYFRKKLQYWGTEYRRSQDENYWINKIKKEVDFLMEVSDVVVVTDVRFLNEADFVKERGGIIIKITSPENRLLKSAHLSEMGQESITPDWLLPNMGELSDMAQGLQFIMNENGF